MYFVYCNDSPLYDLRDEDLVLISPTAKLEENSAGSFEFTILPKHPHYDEVNELTSVITAYDGEEEIFCGRVTEITKDLYNRKKVICEGELGYFNDSIQRPAKYQGVTVRGYLETLVSLHNEQVQNQGIDKTFTVGVVTVVDDNDYVYKYTNWESTLEVIKTDLLETYGGYLRIRKENGVRYLDYLADYPNTNTQVIQFGTNLLDFTNDMDASDIVTAVIPLGGRLDETEIEGLDAYLTIKDVNEGCDYVYSQDAVNSYGWIFKTVSWDDVNVADNLLRKGKEYLSDIQFATISLSVSAVDLHMLDVDIERIKMLDKIRVTSTPNGLDRYFPVTQMTIYLDKPSNNKLTLGTSYQQNTLSTKSSSSNASILKKIENLPKEADILKEAKANASALIKSATNGHVVLTEGAEELLIMNTDDIETATNVWRWNLNGLGYSKNGYDGDYETAFTMDGQILGTLLAVNSIKAEHISTEYKTSVEKQISEAKDEAEDDINEELKSYWTKTEVETAINQSADAIKLSASETASGLIADALKSYSTSAEIKVTTDAITTEVNKKLDTSSWSTKLQQSATDIKIAWNNISKYIQFSGGALNIYDSTVESTQKLRSKFDSNGVSFYRDGYTVGYIQTNQWSSDNSHKSLEFDLNGQGKYMCWAQRTGTSGTYTTVLTYSRANSIYTNVGLHAGCNFYMHGNTLNGAHIVSPTVNYNDTNYSAYSGEIPVINTFSSSGSSQSWTYSKIRVSNGLIVGYWN